MSVLRQEFGSARRANGSRAVIGLGGVVLIALANVCGLGCSGEPRRLPPDVVVPPPPDPIVFVLPEPSAAGASPVAGTEPSAGGAGPGPVAGGGAPVPARPAPPGDGELCANAGCIAPGPVPAEAKCHELSNHAPDDRAAPYLVKDGEATSCFYYDVPWTEPSVLIAWQTDRDSEVMQEWQLFTATGGQRAGSAELCVGGGNGNSRYGQSHLVMAHPRGSNDVLLPAGVGLAAPPPGTKIVLQWHSLNRLGAPVRDASLVRLCTLPASAVGRVASLTLLGTETTGTQDGLPPGSHTVEGSCAIGDREVFLSMLAPHMHQLGRHVSMSVMRANGVPHSILELDALPERQLMRKIGVTLRPGDRLTTRCTYNNNTGMPVPFGASFHHEQCFVYAIAEPAGVLDNGAWSATGASNTCW
jgi:Copper type II ascorbate-dependent monooxygenase, C-terminal domain